jgi:hypothetical protein
MIKKPLASALAVLLVASLVVPATFFVAPQRAHAQQFASCLGGLVGGLGGLISVITTTSAATTPVSVPTGDKGTQTGEASNAAINGGTWGAALGSCVNAFVIQPLIKAAIHALIQKLTANVINWINGGNGTGQPSYVQNLPGHLQTVSDTQALAFLAQIAVNSNSPFAAAITSSLSTNYLQNTSSAGFFAANKDTFITTAGSAANASAFLAGDWSKGGTAAWFALTTQPQNNPYTLFQASQSHLGGLVSSAQNARLNELSWGNGFLSWCGPSTPAPAQPASNDPLAPIVVNAQPLGTAPGDACTYTQGQGGTIETPGTIIAGYANKAVVSVGFDQLVNATDIDAAFQAIIGALLGQVLGGVNGLFGAGGGGAVAGGGASLTAQLQAYAGAPVTGTPVQIVQGQVIQDAQTRATQYQSSWSLIRSSANSASTALTLLNSCATPGVAAQAAAAMTNVIDPIIAQATAADASTAALLAMIQQVQNEQNSGSPDYATDLQTLGTLQPTATDVASAQQATQTTGGAVATPAGSLNVSGGTTIDQTALIDTNAAALQAACP